MNEARSAPPSYVSRSTLAHELDVAESTIDELVKRGALPKPFHLSSGCVRWRWHDIELAITSLKNSPPDSAQADPYLEGIRKNVSTEGPPARRG
jgi:predicted DNA-binding transcriptional regulator AlpA